MNVQIVTPALAHALTGNTMTAARYARLLRQLGHRVGVAHSYDGRPCDVLIALHARRSAPAIQRFASQYPDRPLIVVLTGTDLYRDIQVDADAQRSLELATRLVVLQRMGPVELPERLRAKARVIYQSAPRLRPTIKLPTTYFRVCVVGHLRPEKDPLRTALAARRLPASSRIKVLHVGTALTQEMAEGAREEMARNPRYRWLGGQPHWKARQLLAGSHLVSVTSRMEGSCNVLCEALAQPLPTPVVATKIPGVIGTLGEEYPGYFPVADTDALTALLRRVETDAKLYEELRARCAAAAPLVAPERERASWAELLAEFPPAVAARRTRLSHPLPGRGSVAIGWSRTSSA